MNLHVPCRKLLLLFLLICMFMNYESFPQMPVPKCPITCYTSINKCLLRKHDYCFSWQIVFLVSSYNNTISWETVL